MKKWVYSKVLGMNALGNNFGNWSFLILKDNTGYICSFKRGIEHTVIFHGKDEFSNTKEKAPPHYYYFTIGEAIKACELKYKELLLK